MSENFTTNQTTKQKNHLKIEEQLEHQFDILDILKQVELDPPKHLIDSIIRYASDFQKVSK